MFQHLFSSFPVFEVLVAARASNPNVIPNFQLSFFYDHEAPLPGSPHRCNSLRRNRCPIPQTQIISPYETRFTQRRTIPHRVRNIAAGLVSRIPDSLSIKRADDDDIFLARALEGTTFASARDIVKLRSYPKPPAERAVISDHDLYAV
ncbi:hypothetical protein B0H13DRAFT_860685 [Mycena leptocephala]|nr:hypothetical protein B0H13DRAFT_860685 [Mycena leptocephala]